MKNSRLKKKALCFYLIIFTLTVLTAQEKAKQHTVSAGFSTNTGKGIESNYLYIDGLYRFKMQYMNATAGLMVTKSNISFLAGVAYTPLNTDKHEVGIVSVYNTDIVYKVYSEHTLNFVTEYTFRLIRNFIFNAQLGYSHKWQRVPIPNYKAVVTSNPGLIFRIYSEKFLTSHFHIGIGISSYDRFRYSLWFAPSFLFNFYYTAHNSKLPNGMFMGLETVIRYTDFATISGYIDNFVMRFVWGMKL